MPDNTTAVEPQTQDGQQATQDVDGGPQSTKDSPKQFDAEYVSSLRDENAKWRTQLREVQSQLKEYEKAQKELEKHKKAQQQSELEAQGEYEKLKSQYQQDLEAQQKQNDQLLAQLNSMRRNMTVNNIAGSLGAIDPSDANFVTAVSDIDPNEPNAETLIREALEGLKEKRPYLFKADNPQPTEPEQQDPRAMALQRQSLASFNPPGETNADLSDRERVKLVMRRAQNGGPF